MSCIVNHSTNINKEFVKVKIFCRLEGRIKILNISRIVCCIRSRTTFRITNRSRIKRLDKIWSDFCQMIKIACEVSGNNTRFGRKSRNSTRRCDNTFSSELVDKRNAARGGCGTRSKIINSSSDNRRVSWLSIFPFDVRFYISSFIKLKSLAWLMWR